MSYRQHVKACPILEYFMEPPLVASLSNCCLYDFIRLSHCESGPLFFTAWLQVIVVCEPSFIHGSVKVWLAVAFQSVWGLWVGHCNTFILSFLRPLFFFFYFIYLLCVPPAAWLTLNQALQKGAQVAAGKKGNSNHLLVWLRSLCSYDVIIFFCGKFEVLSICPSIRLSVCPSKTLEVWQMRA